MRKTTVVGLLAAGLTASFFAEKDPKAGPLELTLAATTYPYNPSEAGPKGSGDLGQADAPLQVGERILAECIDRPASDKANTGITDAIRLANTALQGYLIPLEAYPASHGKPADTPIPMFDRSPDEIRAELGFC